MRVTTLRTTIVTGLVLVALAGCHRSNEHAAKAGSARVDPEDPTPGTPGRMTAEEEEAMVYCSDYVGDSLDNSPSYGLLPAEQQEYAVKVQMEACLRMKGIDSADASDIRRRNAEAKADGYR